MGILKSSSCNSSDLSEWNPSTGCTKVSPGCTYCYAEALTQRFTKSFPEG
ncbi:DUF5131 family protein, partial [Crocosphaera watsonii]